MTHESRKLAGSATAGVLVALTIIAAIIIVPLHTPAKVLLGVSVGGNELLRLEGTKGVAYEKPMLGHPACILNVTVYEFTRPLGPGSETDLSISLTSMLNRSEVFYIDANSSSYGQGISEYTEHFPGIIELANGGSAWSWAASFNASETKTLKYRIRVTGIGKPELEIVARTDWKETALGSGDYEREFQMVELSFMIVPDAILVYSQYPKPEPHINLYRMDVSFPSYARGVGNEFNASALVITSDSTDFALSIATQEGITLVEGQTSWTGKPTLYNGALKAYTVQLTAKMKLVSTGTWFMYCYVEKKGILYDRPHLIKIVVSENSTMWTRAY